MSLSNWPDMPQFEQDWGAIVGNPLIGEQQSYDLEEQTQLEAEHIHTLNPDQHRAFDEIIQAVTTHSGKTYLYNTLCYYLHGQGKIVFCVASSGIAALLLHGGHTSHLSHLSVVSQRLQSWLISFATLI